MIPATLLFSPGLVAAIKRRPSIRARSVGTEAARA
jgi:hypothetical protein